LFGVIYLDPTRSASIRDKLRINARIRAREVRLIDESGQQVGVITLREALDMAQERGFDLVEVAPNAVPPVCRLMDYGKYRYEQTKKEREARKNQSQQELKELRVKPKTDEHDLEVKANQARRFLQRGDKVKFTVRFRGRELAHPDIGREILERLVEDLRDVAMLDQKPVMEGKSISMILSPAKQSSKRPEKQASPTAPQKEQPTDAKDEDA